MGSYKPLLFNGYMLPTRLINPILQWQNPTNQPLWVFDKGQAINAATTGTA
ncbi:MAG: hypothetical protein QM479_12405 [Pseudomonadota bacterium]